MLVCTPCAGEMVTTTYFGAMLKLKGHAFGGRDVRISVSCVSIADIYKVRNYFAAQFMGNPALTHLLFVDADMGFEPRLVERMLAFDKDVTAALCPFRRRDAARFHAMARRVDDPELAERLALDYVAGNDMVREGSPEHPQYRVTDGFVRVNSIGTGIMLIRRAAFERLRAAYPDLTSPPNQSPYAAMGIAEPVHQCFSPHRAQDGNFLSEDKSFCHRWTAAGGEIWACVDEPIAHVGPSTFEGAYIDRMRAGLFQ
ncbi:hypothetical protein [Methylobacterium sp. A54F]